MLVTFYFSYFPYFPLISPLPTYIISYFLYFSHNRSPISLQYLIFPLFSLFFLTKLTPSNDLKWQGLGFEPVTSRSKWLTSRAKQLNKKLIPFRRVNMFLISFVLLNWQTLRTKKVLHSVLFKDSWWRLSNRITISMPVRQSCSIETRFSIRDRMGPTLFELQASLRNVELKPGLDT